MKVILSNNSIAQIRKFDGALKAVFRKHLLKISAMPPRRHLQKGLPFFVENVTKQARFAYCIKDDSIIVTNCFATHKEYEKWFRSYKI